MRNHLAAFCTIFLVGCGLSTSDAPPDSGATADGGMTDASHLADSDGMPTDTGQTLECMQREWIDVDECKPCDALPALLACQDIDFGPEGTSTWDGPSKRLTLSLGEGEGEVSSASVDIIVSSGGSILDGNTYRDISATEIRGLSAEFDLTTFAAETDTVLVTEFSIVDRCGRRLDEGTNIVGEPDESSTIDVSCGGVAGG